MSLGLLVELLITKAVSDQKAELHVPEKIRKIAEPIINDIMLVDKEFVSPLLKVEPGELKATIERESSNFMQAYGKIITKIASSFEEKEVMFEMPQLFSSFFKFLQNKETVYSSNIIQSFLDALKLELDNENYMMRSVFMKNPEDTFLVMNAAGINVEELIRVAAPQYLSIFASLQGLFLNRKEFEPVMRELTRLALIYTEEKDSFFTTVHILFNEDEKRDLEEAYSEYQKTVAR